MSEPVIGVAIIEHRHGTGVFTSLLDSTEDRDSLNELVAEEHCQYYWFELEGCAGDTPDDPEDIVDLYFAHHPEGETCTVEVEHLDNIAGGVVVGFSWKDIMASLSIQEEETERIRHIADALASQRAALVSETKRAVLDFIRRHDTTAYDFTTTNPA